MKKIQEIDVIKNDNRKNDIQKFHIIKSFTSAI